MQIHSLGGDIQQQKMNTYDKLIYWLVVLLTNKKKKIQEIVGWSHSGFVYLFIQQHKHFFSWVYGLISSSMVSSILDWTNSFNILLPAVIPVFIFIMLAIQ